jgi:ribonuclease HII
LIDEVGWGALAGPIISVVAVFRQKDMVLLPPGVRDSKKCSEIQREMLFDPIIAAAFDTGVGHAWPWEIDSLGPFQALQLTYTRALAELPPSRKPDLLIVDGKNKVYSWGGAQQVEPKADINHKEVSAASIVAKVFRDRMMRDYAKQFPQYEFEEHKGYGTPAHLNAIKRNGLLVDLDNKKLYLHRQRFCQKLTKRGDS